MVVDEAHLIKEGKSVSSVILTRVLINLKYYTMSFITQFSISENQGQKQAPLSNIHSEVES